MDEVGRIIVRSVPKIVCWHESDENGKHVVRTQTESECIFQMRVLANSYRSDKDALEHFIALHRAYTVVQNENGRKSFVVPDLEVLMEKKEYQSPSLAVDVVILHNNKPRHVLLISRKNEPYGWALPGGFVDYGETVENAAVREVKEEVGLDVSLLGMVGVYSEATRDPRQHVVSIAYLGIATEDNPVAADDAKEAKYFCVDNLPEVCFDHERIIEDAMVRYNNYELD